MFTRTFDAISDMFFLVSEFSGWGQLVFLYCKFCLWVRRRHKWRAFFSSFLFNLFFFPSSLQDGHFSNYIMSIKYWFKIHVFAWFFSSPFIRSPISLLFHRFTLLLTHFAISSHVQFVYMCLLVQLLSSVALLSCSIICICWFDVTVYIYLIKTERQRCRRHVSYAFFCSVMLA